MNRNSQNPLAGLFGGRNAGPVTKGLIGLTLVASVVFTFSGRNADFGAQDLLFSVDAVLNLELWRLLTYPFIIPSVFGLLLSLVILFLFGSHFESVWGSQDFLRFFAISAVGAAMLAIPLNLLLNTILPFGDIGAAGGPSAVFDALLVAMALTAPDSKILLGFVLPVKSRNIIYLLLGWEVLSGLMTGGATLSMTLGGIVMGYVLVTGNWRPDRIMARAKLWKLRQKKRGLYVVRPPSEETLH